MAETAQSAKMPKAIKRGRVFSSSSFMRAILLLCLLAPLQLLGQATHSAATCSPANLQTAINASSAGDTVNVTSPGSVTWSSCSGQCLNITKPITLDLTGCHITDTTARTGSIIPINVHYSDSTSSEMRITGFEDIDTGAEDGFNAFVYVDIVDSGAGKPTIRIDHNTYTRSTSSNGRRYLFAAGQPGRGLFDHNTLNGATHALISPDDYNANWNVTTTFGAANAGNAWYFENNTYNFSTYTDYLVDCQWGGQYVARFNTVSFSSSATGSGFGDHGYDSVLRGCLAKEVYDNTLTSSVSSFSFFAVNSRGGANLVFSNSWSGNWQSGIGITNYRSCTDYTNEVGYCSNNPTTVSCYSSSECGGGTCTFPNLCDGSSPVDGNTSGQSGYACRDQIGRAGNQTLIPAREWLNSGDFAVYDNTSSCTNLHTKHVLQNKDFYNYTSSFTGASGVGSGTRAARPSTCTAGTAYWSTDQGSWNSSGSGGQGVLDICGSSGWTNAAYTPYTYPHPLIGGGPTTYTLSTATAGTGSGTITGCAGTYSAGDPFTCSVTPASGSTISSVTGCGGSGTSTYAGAMPAANCTVTATFQGTVATLTFSPSSLSAPGRVTISTSTAGATIHYTVDGSTPTTSSPVYTHPLFVSQSQTLKALANASGWTNSAVATQAYSFTSPKTRFSLTTTSSSVNPVPFPQDNRACCGSNVAALNPSSGTFNFTTLHNWITQSTSNGSTFTYTIQGFPTWMTGLGATESAPPSDLHTATACTATGTTTTDCSIKSFVIALMKDRTGLSSQPASPATCSHLDYLEIINEFNTDSPSGSSTGWTGTYSDLATLGNDISTITHAWCSNTVVIAGSASGIVGFHSNGENAHYDVALETLLQDWAAIANASLPDAISMHIYPSRQSVVPTPMPTTLVSNSSSACTSGNTPNTSCYIAVKDEVNQLNTTATLRNTNIVTWAKNLPIYSTEGGFGEVAQLGGTSTTTIGASYVAESMMAIAAQNPVNHLFYAANDSTWGCYWDCGSGTSAWLFAFNQMSTWLGAHSITGTLTSTAVTGGNKWSLQLDSGAAELDFCDAWLTSCTASTSFNAMQALDGTITTSLPGSVTLTQEPALLFNSSLAATPTFSPVAGSYGPTQNVTISTATSGATLCYTTDGSTPTSSPAGTCSHGTTYSTPVAVSSSLTLKAIATKSGLSDSAVGSAAYVINGAAATPTFSPVAGTYTGAQTVTISSSTAGATLCYTTDGTTPTANGAGTCTHGSTYSGPVLVSTSLTLKAIASKSAWLDSSAGSAAYVINTPSITVTLTGSQSFSGNVKVQ